MRSPPMTQRSERFRQSCLPSAGFVTRINRSQHRRRARAAKRAAAKRFSIGDSRFTAPATCAAWAATRKVKQSVWCVELPEGDRTK